MLSELNITIFEDAAMSSTLLLEYFEVGTMISEYSCMKENAS